MTPREATKAALDLVSELTDNKVFGRVKSIAVRKTPTSRGYLLKVSFYVDPTSDDAPETLKFKCKCHDECYNCLNLIITCHQENNPDSLSLMQEWRILASNFHKNPDKGLSIYLPS